MDEKTYYVDIECIEGWFSDEFDEIEVEKIRNINFQTAPRIQLGKYIFNPRNIVRITIEKKK